MIATKILGIDNGPFFGKYTKVLYHCLQRSLTASGRGCGKLLLLVILSRSAKITCLGKDAIVAQRNSRNTKLKLLEDGD
jgi:hypothetical protein